MDEKLKSLYDSYVQNGILSSQTTFEQFSQADDNTIQSLHQQGIDKKVLSPQTDIETFSSAFFLPKNETEDLVSTTEEVTTTVDSEEAPVPQPSESLDSGEPSSDKQLDPNIFREMTPDEKQASRTDDYNYLEELKNSVVGGWYAGGSVDEAFDVYKQGKNISSEDLQAFIEDANKMSKVPPSRDMQEFSRINEEAGGGVWGFLKGIAKTGDAVIPQVILQSVTTMGRSLGSDEVFGTAALSSGVGASTGAAIGSTGFSAGPFGVLTTAGGAVTGAVSGFIGGLTGTMETGLVLTEFLKEELGDKEFNEENIRDILEDEELFNKMKQDAVRRGITIGAVESATAGLSRGLATNLAKKGLDAPKIATRVTPLEMAGGGIGETAGRIAGDQELNVADIGMETIAEAKGLVNISDVLVKSIKKQPKYTINGGNASKQDVVDLVNSLDSENIKSTVAKINIKNDPETSALIEAKKNEISLDKQIPGDIKDTETRRKLVELEKERKNLENNNTQSSRNRISEIDTKIKELQEAPVAEVVSEEVAVEEKKTYKDSQIPTSKEVFTIESVEGEGVKTVEVTTNKDGSRSITQKVDGDIESSEKISKDNTLSNSEYVEGAYDNIVGESEVLGIDEVINPKMKERLTDQQKEELGISEEVVAEEEVVEEVSIPEKGVVTEEEKTYSFPRQDVNIQEEIRIESKASTDSKVDQKNRKKNLAAKVEEAMKSVREDATVKKRKVKTIINRVNNTNLNNPIQVEKLVNYVEKTMADADYAAKIKEAESNKASIKKRSKGKKNANIVESAKNFLKVDPALVDNIDAYLDQSRKINDGLKSTSVRVKGVDVAPSFNTQEVDTYVDETITTQEGKLKDIINAKFEEITGADPKDFNFTEIVEMINEGKENVSEKLDPIKKSNIKKAYDTYAGVAKEIITTNKDPFTGEPIELTSDEKNIVKDLTEMDPNEMSKEDAVKAIDALNNFAVNQSLAGAKAITSKYKGESFAKTESKKKVKSRPLKFLGSEKLGNFMNNNFTSIPIMLENMFGKEKAIEIARGMGLSGVIQGKAKGVAENKKIVQQYADKFSKSKPNKKAFNDSSNITERGLLAFMRRTSGDEKVEFGRRKKLIEETIDHLKAGSKEERAKAEDYQNAYDKILKDSENIQDVESKSDDINKKAVEWWTDKWSNYYDKLSDVNSQVYNEVLDKDMNYIPDVYALAKQETKPKDGTEGSSFFNTSKYTDKTKVGTLKKTTKPSKLPRKGNEVTRYISLDFDTNNARTLEAALKDIYTAEDVMQVAGFNDSESLKNIIPNKEDRDVFVGRINNYITRLKNKENIGADDMKILQKFTNTIAGFGATRALGGLTQPVKQTVPVAINTLINAGRLDLNLIYDSDFNTWLDEAGMPISNRGFGSSVEFESINKALEKKSEKFSIKRLINPLKNANEKVLEYLLQKPDAAIARSSFGSYYLQSLKEQGIDNKKIDWSTHKANQKALDYAQQQVDRQQNISDIDLQGNFLGSRDGTKKLIKQVFFPFASFTMNQKARTYSDIINTFSKTSSKQDKSKSIRSLVGLGAETLVFRGIQATIAGILYDIAMDQLGYEESEEEKAKRKKNVQRGAATGITVDMLSPLPITDGVVVDLANKTIEQFEDEDVEDKDKFRLYEQDSEMDYGVLGIAGDKATELIDFIQLANDGTYTQEFFGKETTKEIGYDEQDVLKDMIPLLGLYNLGLIPNEVATTIRYMTKVAKKKSKKDTAREEARKAMLKKLKKDPRTGEIISKRETSQRTKASSRPTSSRRSKQMR